MSTTDHTTERTTPMDTTEFADFLASALMLAEEEYPEDYGVGNVSTFADSGLLTSDDGLVVRLPDGSEFQVTVVKSR